MKGYTELYQTRRSDTEVIRNVIHEALVNHISVYVNSHYESVCRLESHVSHFSDIPLHYLIHLVLPQSDDAFHA